METIGDRIYKLRRAKDWSMAELATQVGTGASTILKWEQGKIKSLKTTSVEKLAAVFGVTVEYLMGYVDDPHEKLIPAPGSEEETELLKVYQTLDLRRRHRLLAYAWELEQEKK